MFFRRKKTKIIAIIAMFLLILSTILYRLADRYLIRSTPASAFRSSPPS